MAYKGWIGNWGKAVVAGLLVGLTAVIISTPLNIWFWGGQTGNFWGDALFAAVMANTHSIWLASFLDELVVDLVDKALVVSFAIYKGLPRGILQLYSGDSRVESLDK